MIEITGTIQPYHWGSHDAIPALLGTSATSEPQAEYWLGAHPAAPSPLVEQDGDLAQWLSNTPDALGNRSRDAFGDRLPFLLKLLSAAEPLSLQAHPTREQAEQGHAREEAAGIAVDDPKRIYRDTWPKPEMMVALTRVDALCGFRDPAESTALFEALSLPAEFAAVIGPLVQRGGEAGIAEVFLDALSSSSDRRTWTNELVAAAVRRQDDEGPVGEFARTAVELDAHHPSDPGIIAALLLNRVSLAPGEALFLDAGNLHAYLHGTGVEIMANSDNVLRGALTSKHIDVDELVRVVNFSPSTPSLVEVDQESPGIWRYRTPAPEFALWQLTPDGSSSLFSPAPDLARIAIVLQGHVVASSSSGTVELVQGRSVFLPAGEGVQFDGNGTAFLAAAGV
ncbi:mannose-6-phosphate isomerase, class I [Aestuariimicrobium ganziense]|uniref:mannose-6-phosphate isomerase, class I n=1 Tax=Aestuariimicrobium ganziense TaxID=2773677 RepID=UPI0019410262|nr:mannose-6-phosphate isomerase, class I [Aestuariimicrobium ganziense]